MCKLNKDGTISDLEFSEQFSAMFVVSTSCSVIWSLIMKGKSDNRICVWVYIQYYHLKIFEYEFIVWIYSKFSHWYMCESSSQLRLSFLYWLFSGWNFLLSAVHIVVIICYCFAGFDIFRFEFRPLSDCSYLSPWRTAI